MVFNRSDAVNNGNVYERIADKSTGYPGLNGFTIQRNDLQASVWCVYMKNPGLDDVGGCDTNTNDFPDGSTNLMVVRHFTSGSTNTLSFWNSNSSASNPLESYDASNVGTPNAATNLYLGNSQQVDTPLTGTILAFAYYIKCSSGAGADSDRRPDVLFSAKDNASRCNEKPVMQSRARPG